MLEGWQIAALREMMSNATIYTQRVLEEVTFPTPNGQTWKRSLQLRIPEWNSFARGQEQPLGTVDFIIPLGVFLRARLPDFHVKNGSGKTCPLVTRTQHGYAMSVIALQQFLTPRQSRRLRFAGRKSAVTKRGRDAMDALFAMFTTLPGDRKAGTAEPDSSAEGARAEERMNRAVEALSALLEEMGTGDEEQALARSLYERDFRELQMFTQYLALVSAVPGDTLNLEITYSMRSSHRLSAKEARQREAEEMVGAPVPVRTGLARMAIIVADAIGIVRVWRAVARGWVMFRHLRADIYSRIGLGPANYEAFATATGRAGSFYFTIAPPPDTSLSYLGWAAGNSIEDEDEGLSWLCAQPSTHEHHGARLGAGMSHALASDRERTMWEERNPPIKPDLESGAPSNTVLAFMRPVPRNQIQIALGAGMNLVLACLALSHQLTNEVAPSAASLLLLTPAGLIAFIAYQRRHHYASTTMALRFTLWAYVLLDALFLFSVVFEVTKNSSDAGILLNHDVFAAALAITSAGLMVAFLLIGRLYDLFTKTRFRRRRAKIEERRESDLWQPAWANEPKAKTFTRVATGSSDWVFFSSLIAASAMLFLIVFAPSLLTRLGLGEGPSREHGRAAHSWLDPRPVSSLQESSSGGPVIEAELDRGDEGEKDAGADVEDGVGIVVGEGEDAGGTG